MTKDTMVSLVKRAQTGDRAALETLLSTHYTAMYRLALHYCRDHGMAEDAVQETSIQVLKNIGRLRREDRFSSWANRIVINSVRQQQRKSRRLIPSEAVNRMNIDDGEPLASTRIAGKTDLALADQFLKRGRGQDRTLFVQLYVKGQSLVDVSEQTGLSVSAIKTRVHRARRRLRAYFNTIEREVA